ncbi:MAG: aminopeptidase [Alistipes sp.]|nr:aminopeptidase [Alistipes sp.]
MKRIIVFALGLMLTTGAMAQDEAPQGYQFTDQKVNPATSVKDQSRSGTCWAYSCLGFVESEIMKAGGEELDLSAMWVVRNIYFEKAVKYIRLHGHLNFAVGGNAGDVITAIRDYGIVPTEVYPGLNYGTEKPYFDEIDAVLKAYVEAVVEAPNKTLTTAWQDGLNGILDAYFGERPETFTYNGKEYTPKSFAESLPINVEDYVDLTSYTHHPFYEKFILEIPDNWRWHQQYNLPLDELMRTLDYAIDNGYTIEWGADVSELGFNRTLAIGIIPEDEVESMEGTEAEKWGALTPAERQRALYSFERPVQEKVITQEMRQEAFDNYQTTDDHGMQIVGYAVDQNGTRFYKVKNSWDVRPPYDGYYYFSRPFVEYKTMSFLLNKNAIPKDIRKKLGL